MGQQGSYGPIGVPSAGVPGARWHAVGWVDASGNFWLFGGGGHDSTGSGGELNDLWRFSSSQWTWMSGSNVIGQTGDYGSKGISSASNVPGARDSAVSWTDTAGNLWLFSGGNIYSSSFRVLVNNDFNDVWVYRP